jgi:hypothetical protein
LLDPSKGIKDSSIYWPSVSTITSPEKTSLPNVPTKTRASSSSLARGVSLPDHGNVLLQDVVG